jgi:peptidoglycan-associated lipoprotein
MKSRIGRSIMMLMVAVWAGLIGGCAPPTAKIKVSRDEVRPGDPVTVSWETKNAKSIELNGQKVEKIGARTYQPAQSTDFEVVARRGKKEARDRASVKVNRVTAPAPAVTLRAEPSAIVHGENSTLRWTSENARTVSILGLGELPGNGEREVSPRISTTYTATAVGEGGTATASARVTVTDPEPPAPLAERPRTTSSGNEAAIAAEFGRQVPRVFFDLDRSDLKPSEQEKLRRAAEWLQQDRNRGIAFRIEGNCDPRGTAEYNLGLGDRRARAVRDFLLGLGLDASRIEVISYGLEKAAGAGEGSPDRPPSWAHDRRADLVYLRGGNLR